MQPQGAAEEDVNRIEVAGLLRDAVRLVPARGAASTRLPGTVLILFLTLETECLECPPYQRVGTNELSRAHYQGRWNVSLWPHRVLPLEEMAALPNLDLITRWQISFDPKFSSFPFPAL